MCCDNIVLKIMNILSLVLSIILGISAAILSAFLIITPIGAALASIVIFAIAALVGLVGIIALFFPCSFKCEFTRQAICRYFPRLAFSITGVIITGLIMLLLNLILGLILTPILLGIIVFFFVYLLATLLQYAYVTVKELCESDNQNCCSCPREPEPQYNNCGCNYRR